MGLGMQISSKQLLRPNAAQRSLLVASRLPTHSHIRQQRRGRAVSVQAVASRVSSNSSKKAEVEDQDDDEEEEEEEFEDLDSPEDPAALTTQQVASLLNTICEDTDIAEVQLQMGGFGLKLRRKIAGEAFTVSSPVAESNGAPAGPAIEQPFQSTNSMDESQILPASTSNGGNTSSTDEDDVDENLIYLGAPKVGLLRKHRYVKGKKVGKNPLVERGAKVKKGQLLAFIEQLGTHVPITAPQAGEVVWFGVEDGTAVEYKEVVIELAPFFGGHIIGDRKYA